jgi:hypothetical protein
LVCGRSRQIDEEPALRINNVVWAFSRSKSVKMVLVSHVVDTTDFR